MTFMGSGLLRLRNIDTDYYVAAVGPGAAKDKAYKNPEYYCYHIDSFAEAEVEMEKFRLPAPSNKRKFVP